MKSINHLISYRQDDYTYKDRLIFPFTWKKHIIKAIFEYK
jgi:hypothetical protein